MPLLNLRAETRQTYLCAPSLYVLVESFMCNPSPFRVLIAVNVSWPITPYCDYRSAGGDLLWYPSNDSTFPACQMNWTKVRRMKEWQE